MDLNLERGTRREDGIFSTLTTAEAEAHFVAMTLEHAYADGKGGWEPKIYAGTFVCVRGKHRLHGMTEDFETFEISGVLGHTNLLFHWGNWNENSEGCVLTGDAIAEGEHAGQAHVAMITGSRAAFARLMQLQDGIERFFLMVN